MAGDMESAEQLVDHTTNSNSSTSVDPDVTEDEMDGDSGLGDSAEATGEAVNDDDGENGESSSAAAASSHTAAKRAPPRKRKSASAGWASKAKKKKYNPALWLERKAKMAAAKAAAAAAAASAEPQQSTEEHNTTQQTATDVATQAADEHAVKQEEMEETNEEEAASEAATAAAESVVEKTERGRPLRASIKARQKQLEEKRRQEEEGRQRRRQEKLLAQARSKTKVKKEELAPPAATQPLSLSAQPPPLSSLSSLPSSSSSSHPPPPPPPPPLLSGERDKSRVVPSHCYGVDWRCVAKMTDCIYTQLHSTHSSVIDWSAVSAMMANVCPLSSDECRLLWRCVAYGMDDDGYGRWKRLDPNYEDEADSDIDVELPGYDETGVADVRTIVRSSQLRHRPREDTMDGWNTQHDYALLHVLATWANKSRQQHQTRTTTPATATTARISLSLSLPPLSAATLPHLPSLDSDWQYIAGLFENFAAIHKSHTFLQARFAALSRMALTMDGSGESGREERVRLRERVLGVLGVSEEAEGRDWLLHSGGRNWNEKREVVDRRRRIQRQQRKGASGAANGRKQETLSSQHQPATTAARQVEAVEEKRSERSIEAATAADSVDVNGSAQPHSLDEKADSTEVAAESAAAGLDSAEDGTQAVGAATTETVAKDEGQTEDGTVAAPMQLTDSADTVMQ